MERSPQLDHLQAKIETALQRAGFERERRRFLPHVTLARMDGVPEAKIAGWVAGHNLFRSEPVPVEQLLYRGRSAIARAREVRDALKSRPGDPALLDELFDLIDLAASE